MATPRPIANTDDVNKVRAVLNTHRDHALFELGINLAFRGGDLLRITMEQVVGKKDGAMIIIKEQKTSKRKRNPRRAELNQGCIDALAPLIEERLKQGASMEDPLFVTARSRNRKFQALSIVSLSRLWKDWCEAAGLELDVGECFSSHTARKTKGHILRVEQGMPLEVLQDVLGHSSIKVTQHYLHIEKKEVSAFYRAAI